MKSYYNRIEESTQYIQQKINNFKPQFGIILGTGLGNLVGDINISYTLPYEDIPNFPVSTVETHKGKLIFGQLNGKDVVAMQGRFHYYEGYDAKAITFPVRVMKMLGIQKLFISNAAGGLRADHQKGDLMIIKDHINLQPDNPLRGENIEQLGPRFPDMYEPYNMDMIEMGLLIAKEKNYRCEAGVYVSVPGPNLETVAEYVYLNRIGAEAVGMSTIPEVIVAVHMGLPVFAISVITDICFPPERVEPANVPDIIATAKEAEPKMTDIIKGMIERMV